MIVNVLICLIILTSQCVCVHSKVININSNNGNDSAECCVDGTCVCSSLYTALLNITNNTIINITSKSVALHNTATMGSGKLTNITITGSNVTIMCNNSGSVYCESCDHVKIEGITWDRCGDPNGIYAGVIFNTVSNIVIINCTFQHSKGVAVSLTDVSNTILIDHCNFLSNIPMQMINSNNGGILTITRSLLGFSNNLNINITVIISESHFYNNGYRQFIADSPSVSALNIDIMDSSVVNCIIVYKTTFTSNRNAVCFTFDVPQLVDIQFIEILVFNNSFVSGFIGICTDIAGIGLNSLSLTSNVILSIMSSYFIGNKGSDMECLITAGHNIQVKINDSHFIDSNFTGTTGNSVLCLITGDDILVMINNSHFTDNKPAADTIVGINAVANKLNIMFYQVRFNNNQIKAQSTSSSTPDIAGAVSIYSARGDVTICMYKVNFTSNQYLGNDGGALYIVGSSDIENNKHIILIQECEFVNNRSPSHGAAVFIHSVNFHINEILIIDTDFYQNVAGSSVIYISQDLIQRKMLQIGNLTFTNNTSSSMYLSGCETEILAGIVFKNNTAENGGAMYLTKGSTVTIDKNGTVHFIANKATLNGGAIYVDLVSDVASNRFTCETKTFVIIYDIFFSSNTINFINNSATIAGNSLYFNIPRSCPVNTSINKSDSILYVPCQFNYSQPVNGKMMTHIPCDLDYTLFNGTGAPIVTSPHELRLYFPYNEGYNISSPSKHNTYFVRNNILGYQVKFTGAVFDYFGKLANPTQFSVQLQYSEHPAYSLISTDHDHVLTESIDNTTDLTVSFKGKRIDTAHINLTLTLTSLSYSLNKINATLVVELIPCVEHPGYTYSEDSQTCVCYHANVKCSNDGNEIKRGYWFGRVTGTTTTSLCPNHYCKFMDHKQTSEGYFELPNTINAQCNHHRVGRACGECSSGHTLSYDSTDCISIDQCGPGWIVLVIVLTCLYWIAVVAGVLSLLHFKHHISLGNMFGIIYFYSMVGILLDNNPYVSDAAFQFISVLSSFAHLTPQFLGTLCFVKGLSGIDQLFIHYSHAVAVSLLLLLIVVAARCSARIAFYVSRCIIRVICLLILLSYTSIASTSLQLLQPLRFTDVKEWYTYSSPHIQYFHGRHAVYGVVAIVCELVVGIGLPLLLLLEPVLSRKINFIKIKPLLDQFQGCYKDKYRWFAAYYLICRQVIFLIVYSFNTDYYNMLFYLQTACIVIAIIHIWIQPYQKEFLNALDGVMLLLIVLEVNINTFPFLKNVTIEIVVIIVVLPLILFSTVAIKKLSRFCLRKHHNYVSRSINNDDRVANVMIRYSY